MNDSFFARWLQLLQRILALHEQLIAYADEKRTALIADDVQGVAHVGALEQKAMATHDALWEDVQQLLIASKIPTGRNTWDTILSLFGQPSQRAQVMDIRLRILERVSQLQAKQDLNKLLLRKALQYVEYSLELISGTVGDVTYVTPTAPKRVLAHSAGRFDFKA